MNGPKANGPKFVDPNTLHLARALEEAEAWATGGYSPESRAYWEGIRDTLRVVLGITKEKPRVTGRYSDVAALVLMK